MPTSKPKSVTIELTPKQKQKLRRVTGQALSEIRVEFSRGRKPLSAKAAPKGQGPIICFPPEIGGLPLA